MGGVLEALGGSLDRFLEALGRILGALDSILGRSKIVVCFDIIVDLICDCF